MIFIWAFKAILSSGTYEPPDNATYSTNEQAVVDSQTSIGWSHLLFGRLSSKWIRVQDAYVAAEELSSEKYSGKAWASQVIKHIW